MTMSFELIILCTALSIEANIEVDKFDKLMVKITIYAPVKNYHQRVTHRQRIIGGQLPSKNCRRDLLQRNHCLEITVSGQNFWSLLKMTIRALVRNYRWRV
jgi:hypothetical protein